jgi:RNA polymerase-binding transcription factor DksA
VDRDHHAHLLSDARDQAVAQLAARESEYQAIAASAMTEGRDDEHDPDGATPAVELSLADGLRTLAAARLAELEHASARLAAGTYGRCCRCGGMIADERLVAIPTAITCVRCPPGA